MTKPIKTSTYMQFNDVFNDAIDELMSAKNRDKYDYRALIRMALQDLVRNAAHNIPEDKAIKLIDKLQNDMLRAASANVLEKEFT